MIFDPISKASVYWSMLPRVCRLRPLPISIWPWKINY